MSDQQIYNRIRDAREFLGLSQKAISEKLGCSHQAWQGYEAGNNLPGGKILRRLNFLGISIDWLLSGRGSIVKNIAVTETTKITYIPRVEARLAAGHGTLNDRLQIRDYIPFARPYLQQKLGRGTIEGLTVLEVSGDSMEPTISDGSLVLVDQRDQDVSGSIMAFVYEDCAYIKRLQKYFGGIDVVSDNKDLYPPHQIRNADLDQLLIIGRVRWIGRML
ncbi:S24 family peptidase [uncultured Sneathiella sp.]|uniref:XRE family transcriptional regulator n=1 Tax=uncultured Sneathiella sp. TaxID=879315 RepID=UPI0030EDB47A|tara:strand:- start:35782 stop:36438 length:657 start_codon:yes stop_codon:yes gene_type:complete